MALGFLSDLFGGKKAGKAATQAAGIQAAAGKEAVGTVQQGATTARADLQPFADAGKTALPGLTDLVNDPNKQADYIRTNPFYELLATDAKNKTFNNAAAKGKTGSGGTAEALQNSLMLLGKDLLQGDINNRFNLASMGQNAAAGQGSVAMNSSGGIADLITQTGNAEASGIMGASNAKTDALNSGVNTALGIGSILALSDKHYKKNIKKVGKDDKGLNVYEFEYKGDDVKRVGHMAQEVEKKYPDAVRTISNIKLIDYGVLNA